MEKDQKQVQELNLHEIEEVCGGVMNNPLYQGDSVLRNPLYEGTSVMNNPLYEGTSAMVPGVSIF